MQQGLTLPFIDSFLSKFCGTSRKNHTFKWGQKREKKGKIALRPTSNKTIYCSRRLRWSFHLSFFWPSSLLHLMAQFERMTSVVVILSGKGGVSWAERFGEHVLDMQKRMFVVLLLLPQPLLIYKRVNLVAQYDVCCIRRRVFLWTTKLNRRPPC